MEFDNLRRNAQENMRRLVDNDYPGRGLVIGLDPGGTTYIQVYWIMGRSENSRNRVFEKAGPVLRTAAADPAKMEDPSLVIYTAMREVGPHYLVTNGDHTDTLAETIDQGGGFAEGLLTRRHEPDNPNWTPRIAGDLVLTDGAGEATIGIVKADPFDAERSHHQFYHYARIPQGFGWCVTTYRGNGTPLPSFAGEPYMVPIDGDAEHLADRYWNHLNGENRVALAVKAIDVASGTSEITIRNLFERAR